MHAPGGVRFYTLALFNDLRVEEHGAHHDANNAQKLKETHANQSVCEKVFLDGGVPSSSGDKSSEKRTDTLGDTTDRHQGDGSGEGSNAGFVANCAIGGQGRGRLETNRHRQTGVI